jgi:hypothetical protein
VPILRTGAERWLTGTSPPGRGALGDIRRWALPIQTRFDRLHRLATLPETAVIASTVAV